MNNAQHSLEKSSVFRSKLSSVVLMSKDLFHELLLLCSSWMVVQISRWNWQPCCLQVNVEVTITWLQIHLTDSLRLLDRLDQTPWLQGINSKVYIHLLQTHGYSHCSLYPFSAQFPLVRVNRRISPTCKSKVLHLPIISAVSTQRNLKT